MRVQSFRPDYYSPRPATAAASQPLESPLEQSHPAVANAITLLWGHAEMNTYFDRIWAGELAPSFGPDVLSDLMLLAQLHRRLLPSPPPQLVLPTQRHARRDDPWDSGFNR